MTGWTSERHWNDECGVFAAIGVPDAAAIVGLGLHALQHRGQECSFLPMGRLALLKCGIKS